MFLWLTCLTFRPRVSLCECTSKFNGRWSLLCVLTVGCSRTDRNKRPRPTQTTLLLSAYARTHIVWCTINALISLNYLLHQSFSSAISQWPTCLWGWQGQPPAGMLHLISGLFLWAQRGWCCASCIDSLWQQCHWPNQISEVLLWCQGQKNKKHLDLEHGTPGEDMHQFLGLMQQSIH